MDMTETQKSRARALRALSDMGVAYTMITEHCPSCEILSHVMAPTLGLAKWIEGESIQDAMPELTASQRELLKTGLCGLCYPHDDEFSGSPDDYELGGEG